MHTRCFSSSIPLIEDLCLLIFSDNLQTKQIPNIIYDELNTNDKELLDKLKKYEVIHPEDVEPVANEFPDFYGKVNNFLWYSL